MKEYSVFAKRSDALAKDALFVPESFSWNAFAFTLVWALYHRMWIVASGLFAAMAAAMLLPAPWGLITDLMLGLSLATFAPELRRWSLHRQGYREVARTMANNKVEAEIRFYTSYKPDVVSPQPSPWGPSDPFHHDPLGLFMKPV